MVHEILPDGVMTLHREGDLELGAHAVDAGHEHGVFVFAGLEREEPAEAAHFAEHFGARCGFQQPRKACLHLIAQREVHAGLCVCGLGHLQNYKSLGCVSSATRLLARSRWRSIMCLSTAGSYSTG